MGRHIAEIVLIRSNLHAQLEHACVRYRDALNRRPDEEEEALTEMSMILDRLAEVNREATEAIALRSVSVCD